MAIDGELRIFCDIDGSLTTDPRNMWGEPREDVIQTLKAAIDAGHYVVVWSARGEEYAKDFCKKYGIFPTKAICKPYLCIDDHAPEIRPKGRMKVVPPKDFAVELLKAALEDTPC